MSNTSPFDVVHLDQFDVVYRMTTSACGAVIGVFSDRPDAVTCPLCKPFAETLLAREVIAHTKQVNRNEVFVVEAARGARVAGGMLFEKNGAVYWRSPDGTITRVSA